VNWRGWHAAGKRVAYLMLAVPTALIFCPSDKILSYMALIFLEKC